jgi:hypothetical protein
MRIAARSPATRRLRLEDRFGSSGETEYDLWLRQHLEAAHRRIAEARKRGELPPAEEGRPLTEFDQRRLEILKQAHGMPSFGRIDGQKCKATEPPRERTSLPILNNNAQQRSAG